MNLNDVLNEFYLKGDRLIKKGNVTGILSEDRDVTDQRTVKVAGIKHTTRRVQYALENNAVPVGRVVVNDMGTYVDVDNNNLYALLLYKNSSKVRETSWSLSGHEPSYMARWTNTEGQRLSKAFKTSYEAKKYQDEMVNEIWGDELKRLNLYNTYFSA